MTVANATKPRNPVVPGKKRRKGRQVHVMGRPPRDYEPDLADIIIERIENGHNLIDICREEQIAWNTLCKWRNANPDFAARWNHARMASAEVLEAMAIQAAREADHTNHQGKRLQMLAYQWSASKRHPKVYNDKTIVVGDADNPVVFEQVQSLRQALIKRLDAMAIPEPLTIDIEDDTTK